MAFKIMYILPIMLIPTWGDTMKVMFNMTQQNNTEYKLLVTFNTAKENCHCFL